jgi:hypothetical protein
MNIIVVAVFVVVVVVLVDATGLLSPCQNYNYYYFNQQYWTF